MAEDDKRSKEKWEETRRTSSVKTLHQEETLGWSWERSSSFSHPTCKYFRTPTPAPLSLRAPVVVCLLCRSSQKYLWPLFPPLHFSAPSTQIRRHHKPVRCRPSIWEG